MVLDSWSSRKMPRAPRADAAARPIRYAKPQVEEVEPRVVPSGTWTMLNHLAPGNAGTLILLSNGTIMSQLDDGTQNWALLTPDSTGSYVNGTWSMTAPMSENRLYFATNVLQDGRVFLLGGEYSGAALNQNFDNTGEIYDPVANTWSPIATFPQAQFGDDPSAMLPNGNVLLGYIAGPQSYIYNPRTNTYTMTGTKLRNDQSDEEGFVKLPDGSILDYEVFTNIGAVPGSAQRYIPATGTWVDAGSVPVALSSNALGAELGPALRLPDGRILQIGANSNTAFYNPATNTWTAGPVIPGSNGSDDAPAAILPNGDLLFTADLGGLAPPASLFDFDFRTNTITAAPTPPALAADLTAQPAFATRMIVTPSGQLLLSTDTDQLWIYTPNGGPQNSWRPTISNITSSNNVVFTLTGTQLNGISEGSFYGDDVENSTNYPIVRITDVNNHVFYARSFNWSSTGVATGNAPVTTQFVMPSGVAKGPLSVVVIANGIPSLPFTLNGSVKIFYPFRYLYNPFTKTYSGNLTFVNTSPLTITGTYLVEFQLPQGVTLVNANATTPSGGPAIKLTLDLAPGAAKRIPIVLLNPLRKVLSTFNLGFPITIVPTK